jgi:D-glycero-D-manno-heptose 1,7-bisphosphate phosphatase
VRLLAAEGVKLDGVYYAYGHPEGVEPHFSGPSLDRKPNPYNLFVAAAQLDLDLKRSWMVGDRDTDVACAQAADVKAILIENPRAEPGPTRPDVEARDLGEAVSHIVGRAE